MSLFLVPVSLEISFDLYDINSDAFEIEYNSITQEMQEPLAQLLRSAKSKAETMQGDALVINLLLELHKKVDFIESQLTKDNPKLLQLTYDDRYIKSIGFEHFELKDALLQSGKNYYARIKLPLYPKKQIALFFEAIDDSLAKITRIDQKDESEWSGFVTLKERESIRLAKEVRE